MLSGYLMGLAVEALGILVLLVGVFRNDGRSR